MDGENEKRQCNFNCVVCIASNKLSEAEWKVVGEDIIKSNKNSTEALGQW